jgi:hypothetical protein
MASYFPTMAILVEHILAHILPLITIENTSAMSQVMLLT